MCLLQGRTASVLLKSGTLHCAPVEYFILRILAQYATASRKEVSGIIRGYKCSSRILPLFRAQFRRPCEWGESMRPTINLVCREEIRCDDQLDHNLCSVKWVKLADTAAGKLER